jgi:CRP/FNR family cyclic AMP-dependent transcriptional regulator
MGMSDLKLTMPAAIQNKIEDYFFQFPATVYGKKQLILLAGQDPSKVYYLKSGIVRAYDISSQGNEIVIAAFKAPTIFPGVWLINQTPNQYFFEAVTDIVAYEAPREETLEFIKQNPDVMFDMLQDVFLEIDTLRRRVAHLMGGNADTRLLFELNLQGRHFGTPYKENSTLLGLNESELGSRSGLSRETVSRKLGELKRKNLISVSQFGIVLHDMNQLEKALGSRL